MAHRKPGSLAGRVVIVTGGGGGLGRAIAAALAADGSFVVVADIVLDAVLETAEIIESAGGRATTSVRDLGDPGQAAAIVDDALDAFGKVDAVVHNAGILEDTDLGELTVEGWRRVVAVNLDAPLYLTRAAWPHMQARRFGRLTFIASASGIFGNVGHAHYTASKAGLIGLMKAVALEGAAFGIKANAIAPLALTQMAKAPVPSVSSRISSREILGSRLDHLLPEHVARLAVALCREDCPSTGAVIASAGGLHREIRTVVAKGADLPSGDANQIIDRWSEVTSGPFDSPRSLLEDMELLREILDRRDRGGGSMPARRI